ncbi:MAG: hypothetical protein J6I64_01440 [Lachnospiraceae bacterium]|nr:hypothetical protein [Lachnospiraceae bacterium]
MKEKSMLIIVLNRVELLDKMLSALNDHGIKGATILHSVGMAHELGVMQEDTYFIGSLRSLLGASRKESRTIFMVIDNDRIIDATQVVDEVIDLQQPDTGILFAIPVLFAAGIPEREED